MKPTNLIHHFSRKAAASLASLLLLTTQTTLAAPIALQCSTQFDQQDPYNGDQTIRLRVEAKFSSIEANAPIYWTILELDRTTGEVLSKAQPIVFDPLEGYPHYDRTTGTATIVADSGQETVKFIINNPTSDHPTLHVHEQDRSTNQWSTLFRNIDCEKPKHTTERSL